MPAPYRRLRNRRHLRLLPLLHLLCQKLEVRRVDERVRRGGLLLRLMVVLQVVLEQVLQGHHLLRLLLLLRLLVLQVQELAGLLLVVVLLLLVDVEHRVQQRVVASVGLLRLPLAVLLVLEGGRPPSSRGGHLSHGAGLPPCVEAARLLPLLPLRCHRARAAIPLKLDAVVALAQEI